MPWRTSFLAFLIAVISPRSLAGQTHTVYWNRTNPSFTSDRSGWHLNVRLNDVIKVVCPFVRDTDSLDYDEEEAANHLMVHSVDEMAYLNCVLDSSRRLISICDSPHERKIVSIPIRKYSPHPNSFEFRPGSTYYWISTSSGSSAGIGYQQYGLCRDANLRMAITVSEAEVEKPTEVRPVHHLRPHRISPPTTETTTPPAPAKDMKMVLGWIERGMQGTFSFSPEDKKKVEEDETASPWDPVPMIADEVIADVRGNYDLPYGRRDYIISEAITSSSAKCIGIAACLIAVLLLLR